MATLAGKNTSQRKAARAFLEGRDPKRIGAPIKVAGTEQQMKWRAASDRYRFENPEKVAAARAATRARYLERRRQEDAENQRRVRRELVEMSAVTLRPYTDRLAMSEADRMAYDKAMSAVHRHSRRALVAAAGGVITIDDILLLRERQKGKCAFCLKPFGKSKTNVDHYMPLKLGGSNDGKNLRLLHERCNKRKSAKHPVDFALQNGFLCW